MENKKLIKKIKKKALKQFESELKNSVLKELYGSESKKQIKKIRKQILREMQEELFGTTNALKTSENEEISSPGFVHTNTVDENEFAQTSVKAPEESKEQEDAPAHEPGKTFEYRGFKFDVDKMSSIVTGKRTEKTYSEKAVERVRDSKKDSVDDMIELKNPGSDFLKKLQEIKNGSNKSLQEDFAKRISVPAPNMGSPLISYTQGFNIKPGTSLSSMNTVPSSSRNFINAEMAKITPARKEEISFFIGKLKQGIDSLEKGEKNILYRKKEDDVYTFSYEKPKYDKNDFSFKFNLDLNMYTYGASINTFEFNIDGFNFDKGFVEILDIIKVLEAVGFSLMKYIDEINEINDTAAERKESIKANLTNNIETIKANTKLADFIFNDRILRVLQSNDINTYGQLKKIEDLTSLKGVGTKTAEKIEQYTKK